MKAKTLLIAQAAVCLVLSPTVRAQGNQQVQLEFTPVPVVVADVSNGDYTDTETQPHIMMAINLGPAAANSGGGPTEPPIVQPPTFLPPFLLSHNVYFPSGDSAQVDPGTIMQVAVTATAELTLQPVPADDNGIVLPPPAP